MKLYTIYTPSHKILYDNYFKKTLPNEFELISMEIPQYCPTGSFYKDGWSETCFEKVKFFIKACEENRNEIFIFSDVDVQFFGEIKKTLIEELGDFDIACQNDTGMYYCSGFFICRSNDRTMKMFKSMMDNYNKEDQTSLNENIHLCKSKFLSSKFFTIAHITHNVWKGEDVEIPKYILMHHANWTEGIENKIKLLNMVKNKMSIHG